MASSLLLQHSIFHAPNPRVAIHFPKLASVFSSLPNSLPWKTDIAHHLAFSYNWPGLLVDGVPQLSKTLYGIIGLGLDGIKHVLGLRVAEKENAKYWMQVLTELRNRGVKDALIVTSDDLAGIQEYTQMLSIKAVWSM